MNKETSDTPEEAVTEAAATEADAGLKLAFGPLGGLAPNGTMIAINQRSDAPTVQVDGIQGAMVSPFVVKLSFIEHVLVDETQGVRAKYVLNLALPAPQLRAMADLLSTMANQLDGAIKGLQPNGH